MAIRTWLREHRRLLLVLGLALVVRLVYWRLAIPDYVPRSDDAQYLELATYLHQGDGLSMYFPQVTLHPTAFRPPLYPALLAGLFLLTGGPSILAGQIVNLALGLVVVGLAHQVGLRLGGPRAGVGAASVVALYPPLIANDLVLLTEPLSMALLLGVVLALLRRSWVLTGALAGALVLTRPSAQFLVLLVVLWAYVAARRSTGRPVRAAGTVTLVAVAVVAPWVIRNAVVMGSPVLVTSNGFNAAAIYSPQAIESDGFTDPVIDDRFEEFRLAQFDEVVWQDDLQRLAFDNIREHPSIVPRVVGRNALAYFQLRPDLTESAETADGRNPSLRLLYLAPFYPLLVIGVVGLWQQRRNEAGQLLALTAAYFCLSSLVFVAWPRVRAPFDLVLCISAGAAIAAWTSRGRADADEEDPAGDAQSAAAPSGTSGTTPSV